MLVGHRIGKRVGNDFARLQRVGVRVRVAQRVGVAAVGRDLHGAVGALNARANVAAVASNRRHRQNRVVVDVGIVGEHVADGCGIAGQRRVAAVH